MKIRFLFLALLLAGVSGAADMQQYLNETQEMVRRGEYPEALERFVWFHDHALESEPAMYGVRLSFALSYWRSLADEYPPALDALVRVRDRKSDLLLAEKATPALFHDVVALNRTLEQEDRTVALFERLDAEQPAEAKACWTAAKEALFAAKRYDLLRKYVGDPLAEFARAKADYYANESLYGDERLKGAPLKEFNEKNFVDESLKLIELALEMKEPATAREVQRRALAVLDDARLTEALPDSER